MELCLDELRLSAWTGPEQFSKYIYSKQGLIERFQFFHSELTASLQQNFSVHYAVKANSNLQILKLWKSLGLGVDIVSGGELEQALKAGFLGSQIIFSGVGKSAAEIRLGLRTQIHQFNVESAPELQRLAQLAEEGGLKAPVVLRVNPDVDAKTHPYISTGFRENKFGIGFMELPLCLEIVKSSPSLRLLGLSCHIGSQMLDLSALQQAWKKMRQLFCDLQAQGFALSILDLGGGLGLDYAKDSASDLAVIQNYASLLRSEFTDLNAHLQFEPGRILVARSGVLLTEIQYIKSTSEKNFAICTSGMNHLLRPALYQAEHRIFQVEKLLGRDGVGATVETIVETEIDSGLLYDVVGPVCESSDFLGHGRPFHQLQAGQWLAIADVGAYGASMMSSYNLFQQAEEHLL